MTKKYNVEFKKQSVQAYMLGTSYPQLKKSMVLLDSPFLDGPGNTEQNANTLLIDHRKMKIFLALKGVHLSKAAIHRYMDQ